MKKVEEEVVVDEKLHLLEGKHANIVINKDSRTAAEIANYTGRRATEPVLNGNSKLDLANGKKSESHMELNSQKVAPDANGIGKHSYVLSLKTDNFFLNVVLKSKKFQNVDYPCITYD